MSKKKIRFVIIVFSAVSMLVSALLLFWVSLNETIESYSKNASQYYETALRQVQNSDNEDTAKYRLYTINKYSYVPCAFALLNSKGEIIADSKPAFIVQYYENDGNYQSFIAKLDGFVTPEKLKALEKYCSDAEENIRYSQNIKLSVYYNGESYIPVEAVFYKSFKDKDENKGETVSFGFTDYEPNIIVNNDSGKWIFVAGFSCDGEKSRKDFKKCESSVAEFEKNFAQIHESINVWNSGGGFSGSNMMEHEDHFKIDGENYCFYFISMRNSAVATLLSELFITLIAILFIVFIIITFVLCNIIFSLWNKNEKLNESRRAFISAAAHELKTPVAVIGSHCECILENIKPEKNIHYVNEVYNESKRMGKMIKVLLEFNRINTLDTLKKEKVSLYELALEEADKIRPLCAAKNIELRVKPSDAQVLCDRTQIGLVLGNFLSNAVKFAPENAKILVYSKKEHSKVCLSVYNSGSHIEDADAQHIWEELYCADKSRTREGELTGMGLPINRVILQNHGFSYGFTNNANGVTFWFKE